MLKRRAGDFVEAVQVAAVTLGWSAGPITDQLLQTLFPATAAAAEDEGAAGIFRKGLFSEVSRVLKAQPNPRQGDFASIAPQFVPLVKALSRSSYLVQEGEDLVSVADLIKDPKKLDAARKYMRRKGEECLAEAQKLDELYEAVTAERKGRRR